MRRHPARMHTLPPSSHLIPLPCPHPKPPPVLSAAADVSRETSALAVRRPSPARGLPVSLHMSHLSKETTPPTPLFGAPFLVVSPSSLPRSTALRRSHFH